jgi:activator of HSP90 ATPase
VQRTIAFSGPSRQISRRGWIAQSATAAAGVLVAASPMIASQNPQQAQPMQNSGPTDGLTHDAEAIHIEAVIKAPAARIYDVLTNAAQFQKLQLLAPDPPAADMIAHPAELSAEPGSAFSLFAGLIVGRQIELVPAKRVVQAWRVKYWDPGVYSIVRFELVEVAGGTKIVFDQGGFPAGAGEHLAPGWKAHYLDGLNKLFS